jgi:hypothetical protein
MSNSASSSQDSVNMELTPQKEEDAVGWTFIKRVEQSVVAKNWCIPLPNTTSPKSQMATVLTHLKAPTVRTVSAGSLNTLLEQASYSSADINNFIQREASRIVNHMIPGSLEVQVEDVLCRKLFYIAQFPANLRGAKHILMEDYRAKWSIEYSGNMQEDQGVYLHSILPKGAYLVEGGNREAIIEEEEILEQVVAHRGRALRRGAGDIQTANFPLKVLLWNCRGAGSGAFRVNFLDIMQMHRPNIIGLTETRLSGERAKSTCASLGFDRCYVADPMGFAGGLWLMWDSSEVEVDVLAVSQREIHASIKASGC